MIQSTQVFFLRTPPNIELISTGFDPRDAEIRQAKSKKVRSQKYLSWMLLAFAYSYRYGRDLDFSKFKKDQYGKWTCESFYFSISHSGNLVAAAISDSPTGLDIEQCRKLRHPEGIITKVLTQEEQALYPLNTALQKEQSLFKAWTLKESIFKALGSGFFEPGTVNTADYFGETETKFFFYEGETYCFSLYIKKPGLAELFWTELSNRELKFCVVPFFTMESDNE